MSARLNRRSLLGLLGLAPLAAPAAARATPREPVLLIKTRVNGEAYYGAAEAVDRLALGDPLVLRRQPDNPYDSRAIEVLDQAGHKLGYVARVDNSAVARMIDAGETIRARIARLDARTLDIRIDLEWLPA